MITWYFLLSNVIAVFTVANIARYLPPAINFVSNCITIDTKLLSEADTGSQLHGKRTNITARHPMTVIRCRIFFVHQFGTGNAFL